MIAILRAFACALVLTCAAAHGSAQETSLRRVVLSDTDTIAVHETGTGSPIIFVPGLLGSGFSFRHVVRGLTGSGQRVLIIDPLGTGLSSRPDKGDYTLESQARRVIAVMDSLGIRSAPFVCHSVGGSICFRSALLGERVTGIVAVNAGPDEQAGTDGLRSAMKFAPLIRVLGGGSLRGKLRDGLIESSANPAWVTESAVEAYTGPFRDLGYALRGLRGIANARDSDALAPRLDDIAVPVVLLIGTGTKKPVMSAADVATLERSIPGITVQRIPSAGQYIQEEDPAAVIEAVHTLRAIVLAAQGNPRPAH